MKTAITSLCGIDYPIIQAGMLWCSGWILAAAVSEAVGLGSIGAGSMYPDVLDQHITRLKASTSKPFAVNIPLLYPDIDAHLATCIKHRVPVVITSAGSPRKHTQQLKDHGILVMHVVSSTAFAKKAEAAGVDAVIAEGFEAGGHNGRDETTTMVLVPAVVDAVSIPVVAAGGIADGRSMAASMALGAQGVQVGSRFVASEESSAHEAFKTAVCAANEGDTKLTLKELTPVRLLNNPFYQSLNQAYDEGASKETLQELLGRGRAKKGMFEGDLNEGELEIGQVSGLFKEILPAKQIIDQMMKAYKETLNNLPQP
jgi:enoyl-[acyl-carrier protein] reductase II